jgi:hypothetical protein
VRGPSLPGRFFSLNLRKFMLRSLLKKKGTKEL